MKMFKSFDAIKDFDGVTNQVRKMTYIQGNSVPGANLRVLDKLIAARHQISQIMGYKTYVDADFAFKHGYIT
ncbi:hypothetical protein CTI12_AA268540 [Artemisia annua]|uniref:Peptidase M3A/M3B catalytic domain-containing protein n=1 Tax=Artemisia annua TaxID=35608 RepID=A0A2U1NG69_ARTAN|nr:hypothetical protein CTI12_AA268540 [Artemisia annua]